MERKVILNVQFEFYPNENEKASKLTDELVAEYLKKMLDTEFSALADNDGLWWHFEEAEFDGEDLEVITGHFGEMLDDLKLADSVRRRLEKVYEVATKKLGVS
jgi:hypothetical protein